MADQNSELEQEINLREYLDVMIKWKILILTVFFVAVSTAAIITFNAPKIYEISMVIELPTLGVTDSGTPISMEPPDNIKAKIEEGIFNLSVVNALKLDSQKAGIELRVSQPRDLTLLKLSINEPEHKKELGTRILNQFFNELSDFYKKIVETKKGDIDNRICLILSKIKDKSNLMKLGEENFKTLEIQEKEIVGEIKNIKANTEQLYAKKDALIEKKVRADNSEYLLYFNSIQQNINYFAQLNNQLAGVRGDKGGMANDIKNIQNEIAKFDIEIEKLKTSKSGIRSINMIQEPQASLRPIGPNKKKNIVLAGILSLMAGIFLAFFIEFLEKTKRA